MIIILFHLATKTGFFPFAWLEASLCHSAHAERKFPGCTHAQVDLVHLRQLSIVAEGTGFYIFLVFAKTYQHNIWKLIRNDFTRQLLPDHEKKTVIAFFSWVKSGSKVSRELQDRLFCWKPIWLHLWFFTREYTWLGSEQITVHHECGRVRPRLQRRYYGGKLCQLYVIFPCAEVGLAETVRSVCLNDRFIPSTLPLVLVR